MTMRHTLSALWYSSYFCSSWWIQRLEIEIGSKTDLILILEQEQISYYSISSFQSLNSFLLLSINLWMNMSKLFSHIWSALQRIMNRLPVSPTFLSPRPIASPVNFLIFPAKRKVLQRNYYLHFYRGKKKYQMQVYGDLKLHSSRILNICFDFHTWHMNDEK